MGSYPAISVTTTRVSITVLSVTPMRAGKLFALASVEVDIDDVQIHGIRALYVPPAATRIKLPTFRDAAGRSQAARSSRSGLAYFIRRSGDKCDVMELQPDDREMLIASGLAHGDAEGSVRAPHRGAA
jgi:hypothetical protein